MGISVILVVLTGCSMTTVNKSFPLFEAAGTEAATIYWLRPNTERVMGIADNPVRVELNDEYLMMLGKGEYTKVNIVPRDYTITLRNKSEVGPHWSVKDMRKRSKWEFAAGNTYYLAVRAVDGEFRGVTFRAELLSEYDAKNMMAQLRRR